MPTIINTPKGEIKISSPMDDYEKLYVGRRVKRSEFTNTDYSEIEIFLMRRNHIILGS